MKKTDLQPWLDYFEMLGANEKNGFLKIQEENHEAYVTCSALHAISEGTDPLEQLAGGAVADTLGRIRAYAGFKAQKGKAYLKENFALHVVKDDFPHDLIYTLLLSRRRIPLFRREHITVITY